MTRQNFYGTTGSSEQRPTALASLAARAVRLWRSWLRRRELRHLATLDDRLLRDVGLSRSDVRRALASPFWQDLDPERGARRADAPTARELAGGRPVRMHDCCA